MEGKISEKEMDLVFTTVAIFLSMAPHCYRTQQLSQMLSSSSTKLIMAQV